jgi:flavin-binding protein dodecin
LFYITPGRRWFGFKARAAGTTFRRILSHLCRDPEVTVADEDAPTYRLTEIVGTSSESIHQAIRNGVARASETIRHLDWFEVSQIRGTVTDGEVGAFQVTMKVGFRVEP